VKFDSSEIGEIKLHESPSPSREGPTGLWDTSRTPDDVQTPQNRGVNACSSRDAARAAARGSTGTSKTWTYPNASQGVNTVSVSPERELRGSMVVLPHWGAAEGGDDQTPHRASILCNPGLCESGVPGFHGYVQNIGRIQTPAGASIPAFIFWQNAPPDYFLSNFTSF